MIPEVVLEYLGPWSGLFIALAVIIFMIKFLFKDLFAGMKRITEVADNVATIPTIKGDVDKIVSSVAEISESVQKIPALESRLSELEKEFHSIKAQVRDLVTANLLPREGEFMNAQDS